MDERMDRKHSDRGRLTRIDTPGAVEIASARQANAETVRRIREYLSEVKSRQSKAEADREAEQGKEDHSPENAACD